MATQTNISETDSKKYLEPDDEDVALDAQQLVNGLLELRNYRPMRELERIRVEGDQVLKMNQYSTPDEKKLAETVQRNTNAWIDTAKDVLTVAIDVTGLVNTCAPAIESGILTPEDVTRASQHVIAVGETLKRIYDRACDMAVNNSNELLLEIDLDQEGSQNLAISTAVEQHRNDLNKFQQTEVSANVPHRSHAKVMKSIKESKLSGKATIREKVERSNRAWDMALAIGSVVLAFGVIISTAVQKP